ncbi:MAG TPA: preprotein translocase subunit YajC [Candidatus Dormibacteraeota bacterium]|nr:preprotein translocase subunit YajC [Candidatus Dormibacteraeota bacterium]
MTIAHQLISLVVQTASPTSLLTSPIVMMVIVMGIFYVLLILPQQKQQKQIREMRSALKNGDKVITSGGIYGTIVGLEDDAVQLRIADQVKVKVSRSAIASVESTTKEIAS